VLSPAPAPAPASGARRLPVSLPPPPSSPTARPPPPHALALGALPCAALKCRWGLVGFPRLRRAGAANAAAWGCDLGPRPRRIADCLPPGSRAQFLPVARGGKMRHLALLALLLAPVLGSTGQGSSTYSPHTSLRLLGAVLSCTVRRSTGLRRSHAEAGRVFVSPFLVFFSFLFPPASASVEQLRGVLCRVICRGYEFGFWIEKVPPQNCNCRVGCSGFDTTGMGFMFLNFQSEMGKLQCRWLGVSPSPPWLLPFAVTF
jgi:hypothetical protein